MLAIWFSVFLLDISTRHLRYHCMFGCCKLPLLDLMLRHHWLLLRMRALAWLPSCDLVISFWLLDICIISLKFGLKNNKFFQISWCIFFCHHCIYVISCHTLHRNCAHQLDMASTVNWLYYCYVHRKNHIGSCNSHSSGGDQLDCLHFLGCKERPWLQLPGPLPVWSSYGADGVLAYPGWAAAPYAPCIFLQMDIAKLLSITLVRACDILMTLCWQIFFPLGKISVMIYGAVASIIFCGYIIFDTDNIIKRYSYDEYIWAAVSLYLDIINLFLNLMQLLRAADSWAHLSPARLDLSPLACAYQKIHECPQIPGRHVQSLSVNSAVRRLHPMSCFLASWTMQCVIKLSCTMKNMLTGALWLQDTWI